MASSQAPVHVAMIVANDVTADTRVKKTAASLARHGYQVTVLGVSPGGSRTETSMGQVRIIRLPVAFVLRDRRSATRSALSLPRLGYMSKDHYVAAKRRSKVSDREFLAYAARQRERVRELEQSAPSVLTELHRRRIQSSVRARKLSVSARRWIVEQRQAMWRSRTNTQRDHQPLRPVLRAITSISAVGIGWRRLLPEIDDYELSFGPELDKLEPDIIHAHDVHMVGIAERAAARARLNGRRVRWIYDAHEYIPGLPRYSPRVLAAYVSLEREYIRRADRVITVSPPIADELARMFELKHRPAVVMNAPPLIDPDRDASHSVRRAAGLHERVPLLVYSGGVNASRGVHTLVEALPLLPDAHLALVVKAKSAYVQSLLQRAVDLGCGDRLHIVPFVEPDQVVAYLASATAAVSPLTHHGNHEVALPNKLFEYLHARLPVIVSDVKAMAELTRQLGLGEVFRAEDPASLAAAAAKVLADPQRYRQPLEDDPEILREFSWPTQERVLLEVYRELLGGESALRKPLGRGLKFGSLAEIDGPAARNGNVAVALGPRNMAGQAWAWAKALERSYSGLKTRVFTVDKQSPISFPTDVRIPSSSWKSLDWQLSQLRHVLETYTHVVLESGSGLLGTLNGRSYEGDLPTLEAHGIKVAVAFHGSDVRDPRRHRQLEPYSPFEDLNTHLAERLQAGVDDLLPRLARFDGPIFVSTMDLMDYVPDAVWLPVVVDTDVWTPGPQTLEKERPVVVHAPSHVGLKGSQLIEQVVNDLHAQGLIEYRQVQDVPTAQMPEVIAGADIVLDQFALGDYGAVAVQAMAAERIVVGHVHERVRERLPATVPIIEATPDSLGEVLAAILEERSSSVDAAREGPAYVRKFHDGAYSAGQLAGFLGQAAAPVTPGEVPEPPQSAMG